MGKDDSSGIDVLLVGYENQENLGLRSIIAYLHTRGYKTELVPFHPEHNDWVLSAVQAWQPRVVGFSLIFQYALDEFHDLMRYLRDKGVSAHFTAGGHFPSLRPEQTLGMFSELDSVVRFEGELTIYELLDYLHQPQRWQDIRGLAYRDNSGIVVNPPRPLIADLDTLPPIYRDVPREMQHGVKVGSILASRGCLFDCSFCSIRQFYGGSSGALRRVRSPQAVAGEMMTMFSKMGIRFFIFLDDDFAARTPRQRQWLKAFLQELDGLGLADEVRWKISCRVDDLEPEILESMRRLGLIAVYLGVESGSETGLHTLNKHVSVAQNMAAIELLKRSGVAMAIGFMLFDPSTTVGTLRENLDFLHRVGDDGYFPVNFCKMLPYAGTPIEAQLRTEGRLKGTVARPDYGFLDPHVDVYQLLVQEIFSRRNFGSDGIVTLLQQADFDFRLESALGYVKSADGYGRTLRHIISQSNKVALETLETLLDEITTHGIDFLLGEQETLVELAAKEWRGEMTAEVELSKLKSTITGQHA